MENINTGLDPEVAASSVALLNGLMADHFTVMLKIWQFHWSVRGRSFGSYHEDMRQLYEEEIERVDAIAERVRALGGRPLGSMGEILENNTIMEYPKEQEMPDAMGMWRCISSDWGTLIRRAHDVHANIFERDIATRAFLEDMCETMEKTAWMLRSRLEE